jgi:16S rRNA (uracil1498-N3)-methyltransferase
MPRIFVNLPLADGGELDLPPDSVRHVQVLRLQPGGVITLFNGLADEEWRAEVLSMARNAARVRLTERVDARRELAQRLTLAVVMPANDRMDGIVEKATELGVAVLQPLMSERSVLRLSGDRADKKRQHWQGVAIAAAEQCGRARVPVVAPVLGLAAWLGTLGQSTPDAARVVLSPGASSGLAALYGKSAITSLSGPEGGLSDAEMAQAVAASFAPLGLGPRILRADTAPLALLGHLALQAAQE